MLAKKFGYPDVEKARFAGLVHDICKEEPEDVQYTLMMQSAMDVCAEERSAFKVWHGIAGAELLRTKFGVMDMDVLSAVRYHTIARAGMSDLEKIVYLADMISVERDYPDVETMRKKALESLDEGMGYALKYSLMKLVRRVTKKAKALCKEFPISEEKPHPFALPHSHRIMEKDKNGATKRRDYRSGAVRKNEPERLKLKTMGTDGFAIGKQTVDLRYLEQLIDSEQTACLGMLLKYANKYPDGFPINGITKIPPCGT